MHDQVRGIDADDDQPVAPAGVAADRTAMEIAAGDGDAGVNLLFHRLEAGWVAESGVDAVAGQSLNLGYWVRRVAELPHQRQVLVVSVGARQDTGLEEGQEHGAAGGEAHLPALIGGVIQLGEPGN